MTTLTMAILGLGCLFGLMALRMPIGLAMLIVGVAGSAAIIGVGPALASLGSLPIAYSMTYDLSVIPLFVLMGNLCTASGASRDFFRLAYSLIGHKRGGLAAATVMACGGFATVSGSSVATAVTMGKVSLPEMKKFGYNRRLAMGAVAAGGTLGILIPPSTGFIVYALLTEQSIGKLFLAGFLPGVLLTVLFMLVIGLITTFKPSYGPAGPASSWGERLQALRQASSMIVIAVVSIGGIYAGLFSPTEAAAVGCFLALLLTAWVCLREGANLAEAALRFRALLSANLLETVRTTAMVFLILIGAQFFTPFVALSGISTFLSAFLSDFHGSPALIFWAIILLYAILGMFLEGFAMLVLTMPIVFPIITMLGFDPVWFGVVCVVALEMGLISPPLGVNVFVVKALDKDASMTDVFVGAFPFWAVMLVCIGLLYLFPQIALYLPAQLKG